jgi:CRP/FNR family transcriptional regulator, cyclic AMP receptor protein
MPDAADTLQQVPFFSCLNQRQVKRLAAKFNERRFSPGTSVVQEGKMSGIGFFVITDGEATVTVDGNEVGRLGPGDHFGELALIAERERTATVTAQTQLDCLELVSWDFREFVQGDPDVSWKLLQYVVNLLLDADRPSETQS